MSLREGRRTDPVWVSAGSLWHDSAVSELGACSGSGKQVVSPRSRTRPVSVAYIVNEDASVPQTEENLSLKCLKEACADAHATLKTFSFETVSLGTTDILDSFYNAGKCWHAPCQVVWGWHTHTRALLRKLLTRTLNFRADVAVVQISDTFCQPSLFYHLGVRESFCMTNNIILYCYKQDGDLQALKVNMDHVCL